MTVVNWPPLVARKKMCIFPNCWLRGWWYLQGEFRCTEVYSAVPKTSLQLFWSLAAVIHILHVRYGLLQTLAPYFLSKKCGKNYANQKLRTYLKFLICDCQSVESLTICDTTLFYNSPKQCNNVQSKCLTSG